MPLLKKKVFEKHNIPETMKDDEEVFYCEITNEIFKDYEEFSERMFLYNSMVWTCCMTGKQNLTYQEALESEENARQSLKEFPLELRLPVLYLANKTHRTSFADMADDVFNYVKDRYFIGENLETSFTGTKWKDSHVLQVIAPPEELLKKQNGSNVDSHFWPPSNLFKYEIEHLDQDDTDISEIMIVDCNQIRRRKGSFNRDKCKLFLKQYVEHDAKGIFVLKSIIIEELGINTMRFDQIFDGPLPNFVVSIKKERTQNGKKKSSQDTLDKFLKKGNGEVTVKKEKTEEEKISLLEKMKQREVEHQLKQALKKEHQLALKKKQQEDSSKLKVYVREWLQPREDTLLENQQKLPSILPVKSQVPEKYFGDMIMILEFVNTFSQLLSVKSYFPGGLKLIDLERALLMKHVGGQLMDLLQMFLMALFKVQHEESLQYRVAVETSNIKNEAFENLGIDHATKLATMASTWSNDYQGVPLGSLPVYYVTISELLRLHLLSSGAKINEIGAKWRFSQRGGYTNLDDPGLHLRINQPYILTALTHYNVVELPIKDKLQIITCLMNQLLTYADVRDIVEEKISKEKQLTANLKSFRLVEKKREQEYLAAKAKLKKEIVNEPEALKKALEKLELETEKQHAKNTYNIEKILRELHSTQTILGSDRAYRQYLKVDAIPAILVCNSDSHGECNDTICVQKPELINADRQRLLTYMRKTYMRDNKEKSSTKSPKKENGVSNSSLPENETDQLIELLMCTTDPTNCPVHSTTVKRVQWSFLHDPYQLTEFENTLNQRGLREGKLLQVIQSYKDGLEKVVSETPVTLLNPDAPGEDTTKKIKDDVNLGYPLQMPPGEVLENVLIDVLLEMEEKLHVANLASLSVKNRDEWRHCVQNKQFNNLEYLDKTIRKDKGKLLKVNNEKNSSRPSTPELSEYQDPARFLGIKIKSEIETNDFDNDNEDEDKKKISIPDHKRSVSSLASVLLQIARAIAPKYLKKPLGSASTASTKKLKSDLLPKWQQSLLASTSYSQIFLHYFTLDSCVMWHLSALRARCKICRRQNDSENMLLCDNCNNGHHLYCLIPKLRQIPKGDWLCDECKTEKENETQKQRPEAKPVKKRRIFSDEEVEEEESDSNSTKDGESSDDNDAESSDESVPEKNVKFDVCSHCRSGGELVKCEKCSQNWHIECVDPPLRRAPRGPWMCTSCKEPKLKVKREKNDNSDSESEAPQSYKRVRKDEIRNDLPLHNAALQELLLETMKHIDAWAFIRPVQKTEVPDYYEIISKPMDFGTIKYKLNMGEYKKDSELMEDASLVFENCNTYNDSNAEVYQCGLRLIRFFEKKAHELGLKVPDEMCDDPKPKTKKRRIK